MKILAFDTSTEQLSIAVERDGQVWQHQGLGGAQASSTLIPGIESLMAQAGLRYEQLDAIAFGAGPGAFTGLRTACSVAQGLGFGSNVKLLPVDSLMAIAEEARVQSKALRVLALLDARMDEIYAAPYEYTQGRWKALADFIVRKPEDLPAFEGDALAGNAFDVYGERLHFDKALPRIKALPTATAMLRLAPDLLAQGLAVNAEDALPRYVRDKVAQTTEERMAAKRAK
jgi:tRNA threonylcarbamoyladenosine biosynthesis protein TsaB